MRTIRVMIKGERQQALEALAERGFSTVGRIEDRPIMGMPHTFAQVRAESEGAVVKWFLEGRQSPLPPGSLIFYSYNELGELI